jgi:hypothetical protein
LTKRPSPELLESLRSLISTVYLSTPDEERRKEIKSSLLAACIDIASSSVTEYPFGLSERFDPEEKKCFFEILDSLERG